MRYRSIVLLAYKHRPISVTDNTAVVIDGTSGIGRTVVLGLIEREVNAVPESRIESSITKTVEGSRERGVTRLR